MAPFGGPVVPEVYVRNATSSRVSSTDEGRRPSNSPIRATRSPSGPGAWRCVVVKTRGSFLDWQSSADVLISQRTVLPASVPSVSWTSVSAQTTPTAAESSMIRRSSWRRYIGLSPSAVAPSFHRASSTSAYCGTFCRYTPTRSPRPVPRASNAAARESDAESTSRADRTPSK
ncbi:hypothetical protein GA0115255_116018 [Streptomyces sp. Ncost-T6T-2b]|nr:hypothetical protein GA0115255_116018 [Streptomyces sp. Ncost-T6T-2b]